MVLWYDIYRLEGCLLKKNVLFVVDERMMGGISVLLDDIIKMIDRKNLNIDVLVLHDRGDMLSNLPEDVNVLFGTKYFSAIDLTMKQALKTKNVGVIFRKIRTVFDLKTGFVKKQIVKQRQKMKLKNYDIEVAFKDGYTAIFTAMGDSDIKYHWIQYDYGIANPNSKYPKLMNEVLNKFDKIISVSEGTKNDFNKVYNLGNKVIIIDNLVNIDRIKEKSLEKCDIKLDKSKFNIITVGRLLNSTKGYDRLIDAIGKLDMEGLFDNCILRIYGDGPDKEVLQNQINSLGLKDKVLLMGRVNNPYKYYKDNDLFILSSRHESFGLVIVEALILGVPVLVTENSATKKLVSKDYGVIVENTDYAIYEGLKDLIVNRQQVDTFKKNLLKYKYDNDLILEKLNKLFR